MNAITTTRPPLRATYDEYARAPGLRSSTLRLLGRSPLHYREPAPDKDTASRGVLRAIHCLLLEPENFDAEFVEFPGKDRSAKGFKEFKASYADYTILTPPEVVQARAVATGVLRHRVARDLLTSPGKSEHSIFWTDAATGIRCKARLDRLTDSGIIVDLKGYGTSDPRMVGRRIASMGAHIQLAHYAAGLGGSPRCLVISYELTAPYDVAVVELTDALGVGERERARLMRLLADCTERDEWPGACPEIVEAVVPDYNSDLDVSDLEVDNG